MNGHLSASRIQYREEGQPPSSFDWPLLVRTLCARCSVAREVKCRRLLHGNFFKKPDTYHIIEDRMTEM
jgi:hypothetical protein